MKRNGCDIYGYPIYKPTEETYVIQSADGFLNVLITATSERDSGQQFIFIKRVQ